jgi:hypothetical protein
MIVHWKTQVPNISMIKKVEERGFIYLLEKRLLNNWVVFAK